MAIRGFRALSTLLECLHSNLELLFLEKESSIGDECIQLFANGLTENQTLKQLILFGNVQVNIAGLEAFLRLLCDTSSINNTFLSNHTLEFVVVDLLILNRNPNKKHVDIRKILQSHANFDMEPLLEWGFKTLPLVVQWFDRAADYEKKHKFDIGQRKLSGT
ncbi:hypothetical protein ACHAWF_000879 [Thalassiosira exigua]